LVVVDQADTSISREIFAELEKSTAVRPEYFPLEEAEEMFEARRASSLLIIPAGLDMKSIQNGTAALDFRNSRITSMPPSRNAPCRPPFGV
jgi:hypothetical protein